MRYSKLFIALSILMLLFTSCRKDHYKLNYVHGVNAEGEVLLPVAHKSFSVGNLMERFELLDLVSWDESGDLSFGFYFENPDVIDGAELLKFNDLSYEEHFAFENPFPIWMPYAIDTVLSFERTFVFESEHIHVMEAQMKTGRFDFTIASNMGQVLHVVLRSSDIKDAEGNDLVLDVPVVDNTFGFDLDGLQYVTDEANALDLSFELRFSISGVSDPELYFDIMLLGQDLAISEMRGYVDSYSSHSTIDTVFSLFPGNVAGVLEVEGVRLTVSERNTFDLSARLVVDTAMLFCNELPPYSVIDPLPMSVGLPSQMQFGVVLDTTLNGRISAGGGRAFAASDFIVNPIGTTELVSVSDTCSVDTRVDFDIPFSFKVDDITYLDTVNMNLANLEMPDMIEELTLELTFTSTLPLNLNASFYMYNSENDIITDTLLVNAELIEASFDGKPNTTDVVLVIDEGRVENVLHSDRIIMSYQLDSDLHNVKLNSNQKLDLSLKARAKYNGNVVF